jgi:hypothetical protein
MILTGSLAIALVAIGLLLAAETAPELRSQLFLRRLPTVLLVLFVGLLPIAAQGVLVGLALIVGAQAVVDVRTKRRGASAPAN